MKEKPKVYTNWVTSKKQGNQYKGNNADVKRDKNLEMDKACYNINQFVGAARTSESETKNEQHGERIYPFIVTKIMENMLLILINRK